MTEPLPTREQRRKAGKERRRHCGRTTHGDTILGQGRRDPVALIEASDADRLERLIPVRHGRMLQSAFAFFRGSAILQAHDLVGTPSSGIIVQSCGDCHIANFGGFATPERELVFDVNDFDETFPAPFEWDLKRLAASFVVMARWRGFTAATGEEAATRAARSYRTFMHDYATWPVMKLWYHRISVRTLVEESGDGEFRRNLVEAIRKAEARTADQMVHKLVRDMGGRPRIADMPPDIFHADAAELDLADTASEFLQTYRRTLPAERQVVLDRFRLADVAVKVVGVGSVGTRCIVALMVADTDDAMFLQVKEARASVLEGHAGTSPWSSDGERVVIGQRLMQAQSDIFLGWATGPHGHHFYVRQLRDMKVSPDLEKMSRGVLLRYADLCGRALARAHAKAGDPAMIAGYLGTNDGFDHSMATYAVEYAREVERDYDAFRAAAASGRITTDITVSVGTEMFR